MPRRLADLEADFNPELLCHRCGTGLTALIGTATDVELDALEIAIWVARRRTDVVGNLPQEVLPSVFRFLSIRDVVRQPPTFAHRILSPPSRNRQCARMHLLQCIPLSHHHTDTPPQLPIHPAPHHRHHLHMHGGLPFGPVSPASRVRVVRAR